ncbi:MAG: tetratricopeptide repeat protein [Rubrivivax sp.]|nr:tetratricopeptide repeat protein [Rubrivivax sp.]
MSEPQPAPALPASRRCPHRPRPRAGLITTRLPGLAAATVLLAALLGGCATAPPALAPATRLLHDQFFGSPAEAPNPGAVFAMSTAMRRFADEARSAARGRHDLRRSLVDALTARDQLQLDYDDGRTRNAAEAFDRRAGNCMSLVLMTAAFAKYLDLPLRYQNVQVRPLYSRGNDLTLVSGHINIVLSSRQSSPLRDMGLVDELTVDFVPLNDLRGVSVRILEENTVLAMYLNNRAAETLAAGQTDDAYAWTRAAVHQDPRYLPAVNTLAVVYLRAGHVAAAEAALRHVLAHNPEDEAALTNLVSTLRKAGRSTEADQAAAVLTRLQPHPPFHFLDLGRQALQAGRVDEAHALIQRELQRQPFQHEAHYWAAVVDAARGDARAAEKHLRLAVEHSGNPQQQARYSAKLWSLQAPASD